MHYLPQIVDKMNRSEMYRPEPEIDCYAQIILPAELVEDWNKGGGWNSAGSEASAMRKWANENIDALTK